MAFGYISEGTVSKTHFYVASYLLVFFRPTFSGTRGIVQFTSLAYT